MNRRSVVFIFLLCLSLAGPAFAQGPSVSAILDKRSVHVDEEIHLTLRVTGAQSNIQAPRLPQFPGFETYYTGRASHITFVNNVQTSKVEFSYILVPKTAGRFTLDPIAVNVGGQAFETSPIQIEVLARQGQMNRTAPSPTAAPLAPVASANPPVQEPEPAFKPDDDRIFIKAWLDKAEVYPNQQVLLTYSLYTRLDTRYEGFSEEPELSGFWIEEFPMERDIRRETVRVGGRRYIKADIRKVALFPTSASDYTIKPGVIKASIRQEPQSQSIFDEFFSDSFFSGSGFFSRRESRLLKPPVIPLKVIPFPERGKPENFSGAVGNFTLSSSVDTAQVKQNEPVTLSLVIEGEGNIETLKQPAIPDLPDFKVYEADSSSELFKTGTVIGGRKTYEVVFIPINAGQLTIPKLSFSFFNPHTKTYETRESSEYVLTVAPSEKSFVLPRMLSQEEIFKKDIEVEGRDIRFIDENWSPESTGGRSGYLLTVLAALNGLLTMLVGAGLWRARTQRLFETNTALMRRKRARASAEAKFKMLKRLKHSKSKEDSHAYFEEVDKVLTQFLGDKYDLSVYGTTRTDIEGVLERSLGGEDPLYQDILEVYRVCDECRFARQDLPHELKDEVFKILRKTIAQVDKKK